MRLRVARRRRLGVALAAALAVLASLTAAPSPSSAAGRPVARLARVGASAFWSAPAATINGVEAVYPVTVAKGGARLRVAVHRPSCCSFAELSLIDPRGSRTDVSVGYMAAEISKPYPVPGTWKVIIATGDPHLREFKFRARLEGRVPSPPRNTVQLPNLRLIPPYEFTFHTPNFVTGSLRPSAPDTSHTDSCTPDDVLQSTASGKPAVRCLRFSVGPANVGAGPFQVRFAPTAGSAAITGTAYQRLYNTNGRVTERAAGTYQYHETHRHYHHTGMGSLELYRVTNTRTGSMVMAGSGPKQGFCTADVMIASWHSFAQAPRNSTESTCDNDMMQYGTYVPTGTVMGISPGWADIYLWAQDGNFIDFGLNPDGRYVVRSTTDAAGVILESNENDNTSYAYIEVTGSRVRVLERGYGLSPWDKRKQRHDDYLWSNPRGFE